MVDCCGISWLRGVMFDLQYGYITILVCNCFLVNMASTWHVIGYPKGMACHGNTCVLLY